MSESVTITLDVPARDLSPNARCHWRKKAKARQVQRYSAGLMAFALTVKDDKKKWDKASILVRWFSRTANGLRLDSDNIIGSLKGAIDGLEDAGLLLNDLGVTWLPPERAVDKANPRIELVVTRIDPRVEEKA